MSLYLYKSATSDLVSVSELNQKLKSKKVTKLPDSSGWANWTEAYPFNIDTVTEYREKSETHEACINFKIRNISQKGFSFLNDKINENDFEKFSMFCNEEQTLTEVLNQMVNDYIEFGNAYLEVVGVDGNLPKLYNVNPLYLRAIKNIDGTKIVAYQYQKGMGNFLKISSEKGDDKNYRFIYHIKNVNSLSQVYGYPDWWACRDAILINYTIDEFMQGFLDNNAHWDYLIVVNGSPLSKASKESLKAGISSAKGAENTGKGGLLTLDYDSNVQVIQLNKIDHTSFLNGKNNYIMQIIQSHGLSTNSVSFSESSSGISGNEATGALRKDSESVIKPIQFSLESKLNRLFYQLFNINPKIKFVEMDILSKKERATISDIYLNQGVISPSYIRRTQFQDMTAEEVAEAKKIAENTDKNLSNHDENPTGWESTEDYQRERSDTQ